MNADEIASARAVVAQLSVVEVPEEQDGYVLTGRQCILLARYVASLEKESPGICPTCGTWGGSFADMISLGHHRECPELKKRSAP